MLKVSLRRQIMEHLEGGDADTGFALAQALIKDFPQYQFQGVAHRCLISLEEIGAVSVRPGDSFTSDKDSIPQFLEDNGFQTYKDSKAVIVEAEIIGFNLGSFLRQEQDKFHADDLEDLEAYLSEAEIIVIEVSRILNEYEHKR